MIVDARSVPTGSQLDTDVCIVGAGTAGVTLARELIGSPLRVSLLESGGREPDPETQSLASGENVGFPYFPLETARERVFGGSSNRWNIPIPNDDLGVRIRPLDPIDFEKREWVPFSGWPFSKTDLDPYYERAQKICRVDPPTFEASDWDDVQKRPRLPLKGDIVQTILYKFARRDRFARDYPNAVSRADNITTYLHANVLEIETNETGDSVSRLRVATLDGKQFTVEASYFVIAVGGIETPRLLLLSNKVQTTGLGNQHDLVGRFFMEHPHFWSGILFLAQREILNRTRFYNEIHAVNGVAIIGKLALNESVLRRERLLNQNIQLIPRWHDASSKESNQTSPGVESARALSTALRHGKKADRWGNYLRNIVSDLDSVILAGARKARRTLLGGNQVPAFYFANMMEQVPNPESRVTLGLDRDRFGQNRVRLSWKIMAQDIRSARRTLEIIGGELERAGLGRFVQQLEQETAPSNTEGGYHHMGTTRMHADPRHGVVDPDCRVHGVGNLFIAGPSVFPTGGYANPVLTIIALTVRLADYIKNLTEWRMPASREENRHEIGLP
jgi:choline dehydrogenase-like flavoprotein